MAGNYPDVPSWRMAYDRDGTQVFQIINGVATQVSASAVQIMNNEANDAAVSGANFSTTEWCLIFPEQRDIDGYWINLNRNTDWVGATPLKVSADTTTGIDGTWTTVPGYAPDSNFAAIPRYRDSIKSVTFLGMKAIKFGVSDPNNFQPKGIRNFHVYGEKVPGQNLDRLEIWHPTLDQKVGPAYFDFGNSARASTTTRTFRVKNISPTKTAQQVRVAMEISTDSNPALLGQMTMSLDGSVWLPQVNVGDLGPGQISQVISLRRDTVSNAQMGLWAFRVFAESTASWV